MYRLSFPQIELPMRQIRAISKKLSMSRGEEAVFPALSPHFSLRAGLLAIPLAVLVLLGTTANVSANSSPEWGDNGSGTCSHVDTASNAQLGTYCMQSVTGWIPIKMDESQQQAISCSNNDTTAGLTWSTDGIPYNAAGPWFALVIALSDTNTSGTVVAWQTEAGVGGASLDSEDYDDTGTATGSNLTDQYGSAGAAVSNLGSSGYWQAAVGCVNLAGSNKGYGGQGTPTTQSVPAVKSVAKKFNDIRDQYPDKTIDSVDLALGKAFLAREYTLEKRVRRTDIRTCPTGMIRKGKLAYTIQEFTTNHQAPQWKDRARVKINATGLNKRSAKVAMKLITGDNRTVVQFQMHCVNRPSGKPI